MSLVNSLKWKWICEIAAAVVILSCIFHDWEKKVNKKYKANINGRQNRKSQIKPTLTIVELYVYRLTQVDPHE